MSSILKKLPLSYRGELHDVELVCFSVEMDEVRAEVPDCLPIRDFGGRALISMVNVSLKNMRPTFLPRALHFNYRHTAFRLLLEDSKLNEGQSKGIFFYKSFSNKALMALGGSLLTEYRLEPALISCNPRDGLDVSKNGSKMHYKLSESGSPGPKNDNLYQTIRALDRAYFVSGKDLMMIKIMREAWPIEQIECSEFSTDFFKTARLEGAFRIGTKIDYTWLPPKNIGPCASLF